MSYSLLELPSEILLLLPEYLDPASLDMLSQSCSTLRELFDDNLSWKAVSANARIGRPDRSRSRSRSRSVHRNGVRDTFQSIGKRAASEERSRGRRGPINWKTQSSSEEDDVLEEVDAEMAHMQVEHPEEAVDMVRPLRNSSRSLRQESNSRSRSRSRSRSKVRTVKAHPSLAALWFNRSCTTLDSVEVILPDNVYREKLVDHPQTYYCMATEPPQHKLDLHVGDHVSRVENDEGITVCDVVDETLNTINYIIMNAGVSEDGEVDPATTLVIDGRLKCIQFVDPATLECVFEL